MIVGIGTDICNISRIKPSSSFANKILSFEELKVYNSLQDHKQQSYLAKRWASKEAISKAFGCGIGKTIKFKDLSILNNAQGAPYVLINSAIYNELPAFNNVHISLSDETEYALAYVVVEKND